MASFLLLLELAHSGVLGTQKFRFPFLRSQSCQKVFPLKSGVGQNVAIAIVLSTA